MKIFQSLKLSRWAIVSKHLRFVNQKVFTLIQNFSNFFRKNDIFIPNLEKTSNSNRWRKHFWTDLRRRFKNFVPVFSEHMIFCVIMFYFTNNTEKSSSKQKFNRSDHLYQRHNLTSFYPNSCIAQTFLLPLKM